MLKVPLLRYRRCNTRSLAGNPDSPQAVVFLTSIIDEIVGVATDYADYQPYHTGIRLCVAQNPANGFPARLLGASYILLTTPQCGHPGPDPSGSHLPVVHLFQVADLPKGQQEKQGRRQARRRDYGERPGNGVQVHQQPDEEDGHRAQTELQHIEAGDPSS